MPTTTARSAWAGIAIGSLLAAIAITFAPASPASPGSGLTCADVGGVFEAHGIDGRGSCVPADPRRKCHVPPAEQDGDYLADLILTPPFPTGTLQYPELVPSMINGASNKDCWKLPPTS